MAVTILPSVIQAAQNTVKDLFHFVEIQGKGDYLGEAVSQLEHSLQAAQLAVDAEADDDTILGALLHDVGRFIPESVEKRQIFSIDGTFVGRGSHEIIGERYLQHLGFSDKICQLVGAHVMAKRYLATDKDYYEALSPASKTTLKYQGGVFNAEQMREVEKDPFLQDKLMVRRWDDLAKEPHLKTLPLAHYEDMAVRSLLESRSRFEVHGRTYKLPTRPTVVVCIDGFDPEYLIQGTAKGLLPNLASFEKTGSTVPAKCAMPSFTNPNNVSIITGAPTSKHGIAGNFFLDKATGKEVMVQDDTYLRGTTILEQLSIRGIRVAAVTAKDKLRKIIGHGLKPKSGAICFSAEKAAECTETEHGISSVESWIGRQAPPQYSGDLSLFVLDAGVKLLEEKRSDFLYLTLSDFIQHHYGPEEKEADEFMAAVDARVGSLARLGAIVAVTGDHGMSAKTNLAGQPNILFLGDALDQQYGDDFARVVCPITDPFVRHHGALGGFVRVHFNRAPTNVESVIEFCRSLSHVETVLTGEEAAKEYDMPLEREGDLVVMSLKNAVIGSRKEVHDLSSISDHPLRSHGGWSEQDVPLMLSVPMKDAALNREWRNFDAFDIALNH